MHPSKLTLTRLRSEHNIPLLTQAWLKFFEILVEFPELTNAENLKSLHLCEAPGAFISALVHFTKKPVDWFGSSLNPWHEGKFNILLQKLILPKRIKVKSPDQH